jgi:hypothetical protein
MLVSNKWNKRIVVYRVSRQTGHYDKVVLSGTFWTSDCSILSCVFLPLPVYGASVFPYDHLPTQIRPKGDLSEHWECALSPKDPISRYQMRVLLSSYDSTHYPLATTLNLIPPVCLDSGQFHPSMAANDLPYQRQLSCPSRYGKRQSTPSGSCAFHSCRRGTEIVPGSPCKV